MPALGACSHFVLCDEFGVVGETQTTFRTLRANLFWNSEAKTKPTRPGWVLHREAARMAIA